MANVDTNSFLDVGNVHIIPGQNNIFNPIFQLSLCLFSVCIFKQAKIASVLFIYPYVSRHLNLHMHKYLLRRVLQVLFHLKNTNTNNVYKTKPL